jgi:heparan-alpha-glucosaminide N-acetyltransferase
MDIFFCFVFRSVFSPGARMMLVLLFATLVLSQVNRTTPSEYDIDTCKLALVWKGRGSVSVFGRDGECHQCIPTLLAKFSGPQSAIVYVVAPTAHGFYISSSAQPGEQTWWSLGDRGVYECAVDDLGAGVVTEVTAPYNTWLPLLVAIIVYISAAVLFLIAYFCIYVRCARSSKQSEERASLLVNQDGGEKADSAPSSIPRSGQRLYSIDTFRGVCLAVMVFVNYGGGSYWFFSHSLWDGLTVADLVFPWFVFLMGVSITLSLSSIMARPVVWSTMLYKIFRRTAILFALGLVVNNCFIVENCRVPGERIRERERERERKERLWLNKK